MEMVGSSMGDLVHCFWVIWVTDGVADIDIAEPGDCTEIAGGDEWGRNL